MRTATIFAVPKRISSFTRSVTFRSFGSASSSGVGLAFDGKDASKARVRGSSFLFSSSASPSLDELASSLREPVKAYPLSPTNPVPADIVRPPYAATGIIPPSKFVHQILLHDETTIPRMKKAARLARRVLDYACSLAKPGMTTDEIDTAVHQAIIDAGAYPSPLNYAGFPKSVCSSINEVICHGRWSASACSVPSMVFNLIF